MTSAYRNPIQIDAVDESDSDREGEGSFPKLRGEWLDVANIITDTDQDEAEVEQEPFTPKPLVINDKSKLDENILKSINKFENGILEAGSTL